MNLCAANEPHCQSLAGILGEASTLRAIKIMLIFMFMQLKIQMCEGKRFIPRKFPIAETRWSTCFIEGREKQGTSELRKADVDGTVPVDEFSYFWG